MNSKQKILIGILVIVYLVTFAANFIFATVKLGYEFPFTLVYYKTPDDVYKLHYEGEADEECFRMGNRLLDLGREYDLIPRIQWRKGEFLTDGHAPTYKGMSAVHAILVIHSIETPFFIPALSAVLLKSSKKNESEV